MSLFERCGEEPGGSPRKASKITRSLAKDHARKRHLSSPVSLHRVVIFLNVLNQRMNSHSARKASKLSALTMNTVLSAAMESSCNERFQE